MKKTTLQTLEAIVAASDIEKSERLDFYHELLSHLEVSKRELIKHGFSDEQAEEQALLKLGSPEEIGEEIQQAVYPYRKQMFYSLVILSLSFTFFSYLISLFINFDAHMLWMLSSLVINLTLLFVTHSHKALFSERYFLNLLLSFHLFIHFYGLFITISIDHFSSGVLLGLWILIFLLSLALIYRVTAIDSRDTSDLFKQMTHLLNFVLAFFIIGISMFITWALLAFDIRTASMLLLILPALVWLGFYMIQIKALETRKRWLVSLLISLEVLGLLIFLYSFIFIKS